MNYFLTELQRILMLLSLSAIEQLQYLNNLKVDTVDELALEFDDIYVLCKNKYETGVLNKEEFDLLNELNQKLNFMSNNKNLWTKNSLINSTEWEEIRQLTRQIRIEK